MVYHVIRGIVVTLAVLSVPVIAGYFYLLSSLQSYEADFNVSGVSQVVDIIRDKDAIPHIYAKSDEDAYFALGFVHAQDRLWQMNMQRRISQGRLSEIAGSSTLSIDKFLRTLSIYRSAEASFDNLNEQTQSALVAYSAGVNEAVRTWDGALPPEFLLTQTTPAVWSPADSLAWMGMMALDLSTNWRSELMRARLLSRLSPEQVEDLYPPYGNDAPVLLPRDLLPYFQTLETDNLAWLAQQEDPSTNGSNNWVVSGARSATGQPLLANDPHLSMSIPSLWYAAHLNTPNFAVRGVSLPGVPAIILGRTDHVAWGFTNTGPDTQDLFIEKLNPENPDQYLTPEGWQDFEVINDVIEVKGEAPVSLTIRIGRNGPIMSDHHTGMAEATIPEHVLAFRWTALTPENTSLQAAVELMQARNVFEVDRALRDFVAPMQSILFADVDGNIGWRAPGLIPIRGDDNTVQGLIPVPGWQDQYQWQGFIPYDALPGTINPESGVLYTANHKVVSDTYPHFLTSEWQEPYRANRIAQLLSQRPTHSFSSFARMQMDIQSGWAQEFLSYLQQTPSSTLLTEQALGLLTGWSGEMSGDQPQPLIFMAWYREFVRQVTADELDALFDEFWGYHVRFMRGVVSGNYARWCDDIGTQNVTETCQDQSAVALERAMLELVVTLGDDVSAWEWQDKHTLVHRHRPFSEVSFLKPFFEKRQMSGGGPFTVMQARNRFRHDESPYHYIHGPGYRAIFDLADLDASGFIFSTGQSGNPLSDHYFDFAERWLEGDYITMTSAIADITTGMRGTTTLSPQ